MSEFGKRIRNLIAPSVGVALIAVLSSCGGSAPDSNSVEPSGQSAQLQPDAATMRKQLVELATNSGSEAKPAVQDFVNKADAKELAEFYSGASKIPLAQGPSIKSAGESRCRRSTIAGPR